MTGSGAVPKLTPGPKRRAVGSVCKKTQQARPARPSKQSVPGRPQSAESLILDERVPGLIFDSLSTVQAALVSASKELPYGALRQAMALGEQEKRELTSAAHAVAAKSPAFFSAHKDGVEFGAVFMAISAAKMDHLFSLLDQSGGSPVPGESGRSEHICSVLEALGITLIILAPLWLLVVILVLEHIRR